MSLEANKFLNRLYGEAIQNQQRQDDIIRNLIKGKKEIQEVEETKQLNTLDYQKFRRTFNLFSDKLYTAISKVNEYEDTGDVDDSDNLFSTLQSINNLALAWNNVVISLSLLSYKTLNQNDKTKIYNIILEKKKDLVVLNNYLDDPKFADTSDQKKIVNDIIKQIDENLFDQISL